MAANGPMPPNSSNRSASAPEIAVTGQPNSVRSGSSITPGTPSAADVESITRKVTAAMTHP